MNTHNKIRGLTLIEIMIALAIGSLLMMGTITLLISNKRIYTEQNDMARVQENARFAVDMLVNDIRMAGYVGCSDAIGSVNNTLTAPTNDTTLFTLTNPIEGSENRAAWAPSTDTWLTGTGTMLTGSDAITLRYFAPISTLSLSANMADGATGTDIALNCTGNCSNDLTVGENLAISDCAVADIFDVTAVTDADDDMAHGNATFSKAYDTTAQISRYITNRYYIANGNNDKQGNPIPTLFRYTFAQDRGDVDGDTNTTEFLEQSQALIEGVENMQILYGVDTNGDPNAIADTYVNAAGVAGASSWNDVVSVRIGLLLRTIEPNTSLEPDSNTYSVLGTAVYTAAPNDNYRRRTYTTTVQIRNRTQ